MQERGLLLLRVRFHLIELDHARLNRLLVSDAPVVQVLHAQLAQAMPQGVGGH